MHIRFPQARRVWQPTLGQFDLVRLTLQLVSWRCHARPVMLGPVSFLLLAKTVDGSDRLALLDGLVKVYAELHAKLHDAGAEWVQLDEPCLVLDLDDAARNAC